MTAAEQKWVLAFSSLEEADEFVKEGRVCKLMLNEKWICIAKAKGEFYAFDESCPHQGHPLVQGSCKNGKIECPLHKYKFDLKSGYGHGLSLTTYPVKLVDGKIYVAFQKTFWDS